MTTAPPVHATPMPASRRVSRRTVLGAVAGTLAGMPVAGRAQTGTDWPNQAVRYVNLFPPGGATDTLSRFYCAKMSEIAGQQFVVENRSGSGGNRRRRRDRQVAARRLHDRPGQHRLARHRADALCQPALRCGAGLHLSSPASGSCRTCWWSITTCRCTACRS